MYNRTVAESLSLDIFDSLNILEEFECVSIVDDMSKALQFTEKNYPEDLYCNFYSLIRFALSLARWIGDELSIISCQNGINHFKHGDVLWFSTSNNVIITPFLANNEYNYPPIGAVCVIGESKSDKICSEILKFKLAGWMYGSRCLTNEVMSIVDFREKFNLEKHLQ
jgi:hypothetical protein